jgi:hypothetical protein
MSVEKLLAEAEYVVDGQGQRKAVLLDLAVWEDIIALLQQKDEEVAPHQKGGWDALMLLMTEIPVDTGIPDLAHEHDHYLYGTPKRGDS